MGKRKERRLAAMSAAGRRVKLDLFAEPSGEMVDATSHEVGGDPDQDNHSGVPMSPSSGQKQKNPLLLLGQYSDDESDEESNKRPKHAVDRNSSPELDVQVEEPVAAGVEPGNTTVTETTDSDDHKEAEPVETVKDLDTNDANESSDFNTEVAALHNEIDLPPQIIPPEASEIQADSDTSGGWKMVLHEDSNRYYYWNTLTGQTSWDVPSGVALETDVSGGQNASSAGEERDGALEDMRVPAHVVLETATYGEIGCIDPISQHGGEYGNVSAVGEGNSEVVHFGYDTNHNLSHYGTGVAGVPYQATSMLPEYDPSHQPQNAISEQPLAEHHVASQDMVKHFTENSQCYGSTESTDAHSARLVKYSESLLQRLMALDRFGQNSESRGLIMKEIEVRLSDCKALSSYGSLLLPFWWHTETQLNQLDSIIINEEASLLVQTEEHNKIEAKPEHPFVNNVPLPSSGEGSAIKNSSVKNDLSSTSNTLSEGQADDRTGSPDGDDVRTQRRSCGSDDQQLDSEQGQAASLETHSSTTLAPIPETHAEEDMDMDVEMEVDEETTEYHIAAQDLSISECPASFEPNPPSSPCPAVPSDEPNIPPPPDEEWIPPPPPDCDLIPPPPPEDDPPAPCPPPPYSDTMPGYSYQGQYDLGYTVQNYEYYAPTASEVTNGNYYAHNGGTYSIEPPHPPTYATSVPSAFPEIPLVVNPIEPSAFYVVSSATMPSLPVVSSAGSEAYVESVPISYHSNFAASDQSTSVGFAVEPGTSYLPEVNSEPGISHVPSTASTADDVRCSLINGSTADALPSAAPKNQSKVTREKKKRTVAAVPSLRSNKKVSSLVDKWKAAKEELHGEENEEPESGLDFLEKKRQKKIEEWCAKQIATGEAKDNVNFLPLGGDWRERVKRKKAKAEAESVRTASSAGDEKKQPDLVELAKNLPSGWQAYWDESTKGVYYGNTITSETTWTRPTR